MVKEILICRACKGNGKYPVQDEYEKGEYTYDPCMMCSTSGRVIEETILTVTTKPYEGEIV